MYNKALKWVIIVLFLLAFIVPVVEAATPAIQTNKQTVVRTGDNGENHFNIVYFGNPASEYDIYINNGDISDLTPPTMAAAQNMDNVPVAIGSAQWQFFTDNRGFAYITFDTSGGTTAGTYTFKVTDPTGVKSDATINILVLESNPTPTAATPTPTPSTGSLDIRSNPSGATIYVDNAVKGITPLVVSGVSNGEHTVTLQKSGYQDGVSTTTVMGETELVDITLLLSVETPTPTATVNYTATLAAIQQNVSQQNESIIAVETKISEIDKTVVTQATLVSAHLSATTQTTPNYSATIATLQSIQAEQQEEIDLLTATINAIKSLLGLG